MWVSLKFLPSLGAGADYHPSWNFQQPFSPVHPPSCHIILFEQLLQTNELEYYSLLCVRIMSCMRGCWWPWKWRLVQVAAMLAASKSPPHTLPWSPHTPCYPAQKFPRSPTHGVLYQSLYSGGCQQGHLHLCSTNGFSLSTKYKLVHVMKN